MTAFALVLASILITSNLTPGSSEELKQLHGKLVGSNLDGSTGIPVQDIYWQSEFLEVHLKSGAIFPERPVEGYPVGAFFVGQGSVTFHPEGMKARNEMRFWFGESALEEEPIEHAYFFMLHGMSLAEQLGLPDERTVPFEAYEAYTRHKRAMRQVGLRVTHAFLNRQASTRGVSLVMFSPQSIRADGNESAMLCYGFDPTQRSEIALYGLGHKEISPRQEYRDRLRYLAGAHSNLRRYRPEIAVSEYVTSLDFGTKIGTANEETTITFVPRTKIASLLLELTPIMQVQAVYGPDGNELPFMQWKYGKSFFEQDQRILVATKQPLERGREYSIRVVSSGKLFQRGFAKIDRWALADTALGASVDESDLFILQRGQWQLADEDSWYPWVDQTEGSRHELIISVPGRFTAVGVGELVSEEKVNKKRRFHFRTTRPSRRSTFYLGQFMSKKEQADETEIEVFVNRDDNEAVGNLKHTAVEISNIVKVFNRILNQPTDLGHLRVASTPTFHGRGFEGLLLLSHYAGFDTDYSRSDLFRAHEVAHTWWGNQLDVKDWPADRWIMESFAEYMAMEYYKVRFRNPGKAKEQMFQNWVQPVLKSPVYVYRTLGGDDRRVTAAQARSLSEGSGLVYTKGPWVLHMLRYLFKVKNGSDEGFWLLLQDFLEKFKYKEAGTADFAAMTSQHLEMDLRWFFAQWIYGTGIPTVRWNKTVEPKDGAWLVRVDAVQEEGTDFYLTIPVYAHFSENRVGSRPLVLKGATGSVSFIVPEKPARISLNDDYEALVRLRN